MLYFNTTKQNIIDSVSKKVFWAFEIATSGGFGMIFEDEGGSLFSDEGGMSFEGSAGGTYYWSTVTRTWSGNNYVFKIIPESFDGVVLNRNKSELNLHSPNILEFDVTNSNNSLSADTFVNAVLTLKLVVNDYTNEEIIRQWEFIIKRVDPGRQKLHFYCEDYVYRYLKGDYPNTELVRNVFPASNSVINDNICIPEPYGTAYIPIRSVYDADHTTYTSTTISIQATSNGSYCKIIDTSSGLNSFEIGRSLTVSGCSSTANNQSSIILNKSATQLDFAISEGFVTESAGASITLTQGSRTYLLGSTTYTFTINKVRSPRDWGKKSEWSSTAYTFTQAIKTDPSTNNWRTFQPIINDVNNDGTADAPGYWQQGEVFLDIPTKFMRSDSSSLTNPADIMKNVLNNMGVSSTRLKLDNGLIGYWSFDENTGTSVYDGSTYNHNITVSASSVWSTGKSGSCISYTSLITASASTFALPTSQISVSFWVNSTSLASGIQEFVRQASPSTHWTLFCSSIAVSFNVYESTIRNYDSKTINILDGNWHHLVGTYDGTNVRVWVDSSSGGDSDNNPTTGIVLNSSGQITIGTTVVNYVDGKVDELRVYNRALSSTEIDELYNNPPMRGWWSNARNTYQQWGLNYNGAFWYKEPKEKALAKLLNMCHSVLNIEDKIELRPLIKESQYTLDNSDILTTGNEKAETSFKYNNMLSDEYSDCGYIAWQQNDQSQDRFIQLLVGAKDNTKTKISNNILEIPFVQDSQQAQIIGILYYQRLLLRKAILSFMAKSKLLGLQPDDVITINHNDYGGSYNVLVESIIIKKDLSIQISCVLFSQDLDDWDDLSPSAIVVAEDDPNAKIWEPAIVGSLSDQDIGKQLWAKSYLVVAQNSNQGDYTDIQSAINALKGTNYSGIYIRKGTYNLTSPIYMPSTISVDVIGENKEDVIITPTSGINGIVFKDCKNYYSLSNFKLLSQDSSSQSSYSNMINATSSTGNFSFKNLIISGMKLYDSSTDPNGNKGIYAKEVLGSIKVNNCFIDGGFYGLQYYYVNNIDISYNNFTNQLLVCNIRGTTIVSQKSENINIESNYISNFKHRSLYLRDCDKVNISFNKINSNQSTYDFGFSVWESAFGTLPGFVGVQTYNVDRLKVIGNDIDLTYNSTVNIGSWLSGIRIQNPTRKINISNNNINIYRNFTTSSTGLCFGIRGYLQDAQIGGNVIKIDSNTTDGANYGVYLSALSSDSNQARNIVQGNHIDCVNNNAYDYGIVLLSNLNQGGDNITYNVGVSILNSGSSNNVTAKDI